MLSGLAADRNRRPPTALLLAEALETIAGNMEAAGASAPAQLPQTTMITRPVSYYIFLAMAALALFAISMFVTILLLR
jgi:hypothetical protein